MRLRYQGQQQYLSAENSTEEVYKEAPYLSVYIFKHLFSTLLPYNGKNGKITFPKKLKMEAHPYNY
jgi:hypothetical protein